MEKAISPCIAQGKLAHVPYDNFKQLVSSKSLKNCRVKVDDVTNAHNIFGPNLPVLGGRTTRQKPDRLEPEYIGISRGIYECHKIVTLTADVVFVNRIAFLVTLSRDIRLYSCEHIIMRTAKQQSKTLRRIVNIYARGGFTIRTIMMDKEFEKIQEVGGMELFNINTTSSREHVSEIERTIQYIKQSCRCVVKSLSISVIKFVHKQIMIRMWYFVTIMVNAVPANLGVSQVYSLR